MRDSKIEQRNFYTAAKFYLKKGFSIFPVAYGTEDPLSSGGVSASRGFLPKKLMIGGEEGSTTSGSYVGKLAELL
jgi:hypothetical protein